MSFRKKINVKPSLGKLRTKPTEAKNALESSQKSHSLKIEPESSPSIKPSDEAVRLSKNDLEKNREVISLDIVNKVNLEVHKERPNEVLDTEENNSLLNKIVNDNVDNSVSSKKLSKRVKLQPRISVRQVKETIFSKDDKKEHIIVLDNCNTGQLKKDNDVESGSNNSNNPLKSVVSTSNKKDSKELSFNHKEIMLDNIPINEDKAQNNNSNKLTVKLSKRKKLIPSFKPRSITVLSEEKVHDKLQDSKILPNKTKEELLNEKPQAIASGVQQNIISKDLEDITCNNKDEIVAEIVKGISPKTDEANKPLDLCKQSGKQEKQLSNKKPKRVWFQRHQEKNEEFKKNTEGTKLMVSECSKDTICNKEGNNDSDSDDSWLEKTNNKENRLGDLTGKTEVSNHVDSPIKNKTEPITIDCSSQSEGELSSSSLIAKKKFKPNLQVKRRNRLSSFSAYSSCDEDYDTQKKKMKASFNDAVSEEDDGVEATRGIVKESQKLKRKQRKPRKKRAKSKQEGKTDKEKDENKEPKEAQSKYSDERDMTLLTMQELIYYRPKSFKKVELKAKSIDPSNVQMVSSGDENEEKVTNPKVKENPDDKTLPMKSEDLLPAEKEVEKQQQDETDDMAPQIMINEDGEIVIDETSLTIQKKVDDSALKKNKVLYEDSLSFGGNRRNKNRGKRWNIEDTLRFYKALSQIGTDFTLMTKLFNTHTRNDLKKKFKLEEKINADLVDRALENRLPMNMEMFSFKKNEIRDLLDEGSETASVISLNDANDNDIRDMTNNVVNSSSVDIT